MKVLQPWLASQNPNGSPQFSYSNSHLVGIMGVSQYPLGKAKFVVGMIYKDLTLDDAYSLMGSGSMNWVGLHGTLVKGMCIMNSG